jgi:hypothetical protein
MDKRPLEYNVVCVKWGDKFTPEHVNRLYRMAKKNISLPFTFYCYTENPIDLVDGIKVIPLDETLDLKAWWWKLTLFKKNNRPKGINLYFDLDVVIQNNVDDIFNAVVPNKLTIPENFDLHMDFTEYHFDQKTIPVYNSSIMIWYNNENINLYEKFIKNSEMYIKIYYGMDRFFSYEFDQISFNTLPEKFYYYRRTSDYLDDSDFDHYDITLMREWGSIITTVFHNPNRSICVFNGCHEEVFYINMESYFS